jgi:hypothetical protein
MNSDTENEVVATGELFKKSNTGSKTWALRNFVLTGLYLIYYTKDGQFKGKMDISDCFAKTITPEECGTKNAKYCFLVSGPRKQLILCASNERNRAAWIILINEQSEEYRDIIRRYLKTGEELIANEVIIKKSSFGISSKIRMVITNYPRILLVHPTNSKLFEQIIWTRDAPPILIKVIAYQNIIII